MTWSITSAGGNRSTSPSHCGHADRSRASGLGVVRGEVAFGGAGRGESLGEVGRETPQRVVGDADESGPQERRRPQVGFRRREHPDEGHQILDLVGVVEAEALVDVGPDRARRQRALELAMALARTEEHRDVAGAHAPRRVAAAIGDETLVEQAHDLARDAGRTGLDVVADHEAEAWLFLEAGDVASRQREPVVGAVPERDGRRRARLHHADGEVVGEGEEIGMRSEALRDRLPDGAIAGELVDEGHRFVEQPDVGVPEAIDRLLAIADEEQRRRQGTLVPEAETLAPCLHERRDELPLQAARVLELVHEHVLVAGLEPEPAARELVHLAEQQHGAREHLGEVERVVQHERLQVAAVRQSEDAPDAAREQHVERRLEPAAGDHERVGDQGQTRTMRVVGRRRGEVGLRRRSASCGAPPRA